VLNGASFTLLPEVAQFLVEVLGAFFGKEDSCAFKFHPTHGSWNRVAQPVRPLHIEVDVVGSRVVKKLVLVAALKSLLNAR
jgi:hypothetical protein